MPKRGVLVKPLNTSTNGKIQRQQKDILGIDELSIYTAKPLAPGN